MTDNGSQVRSPLEGAPRSLGFTDVDFDKPGKHGGFIMLPHSPDDDAWGVTRVPVAVVQNGAGPTVILQGGNHGDEYEGPITITDLYRELDSGSIQGRLILLPAVNVHAVQAGRRTSPVDRLNFNRVFPGNPAGTITEEIAAFVTGHILPMANAFIDLHSGGSSLLLTPSAVIIGAASPECHQRNVALAQAFGAPMTLLIDNLGETRTATATAARAGLATMATEMGGGGGVSPETLAICKRGVRNVLGHLGVMEAAPQDTSGAGTTEISRLPGVRAFVYAQTGGVFEPLHCLGERVRRGQAAGRIHCLWDVDRPPELLAYAADGVLYGVRPIGRVQPGNCCLVVATPYSGDQSPGKEPGE